MSNTPIDQLCPGCFENIGKLQRCPRCAYDQDLPRDSLFLPHRHLLGEQYVVGQVLGRPGGFGITYLGWDVNLERKVAIKEYLPKKLAERGDDGVTVVVSDPQNADRYEFGRQEFLAEARTVARFDHPNVVRVRNFFRANDSAYLVMDYYSGVSLADHLQQNDNRIAVATAIGIIRPILAGLQLIHDNGYLHRDVKPANIYLATMGRPILLDFGAARLATSQHGRADSVVLTDGYAPLEQYQRGGKQGPWTDVYGTAATLYRLISGEIPPIAMDRIGAQELTALTDVPDVPRQLITALQHAMAVHVDERTSSARQFASDLEAVLSEESSSRRSLVEVAPEPTPKSPATVASVATAMSRRSGFRFWPQTLLLASVVLLSWFLWPAASAPPALRIETATAPAAHWASQAAAAATPAQPPSTPRLLAIPSGDVLLRGQRQRLPPYAIAAVPVSVGEFAAFVAATEYNNPAWEREACHNPGGSPLTSWRAPGRGQSDGDPVVCVSARDAIAYARWLSLNSGGHWRLPTYAQWYRAGVATLQPHALAPREWTCSGAAGGDAILRCTEGASERRLAGNQPGSTAIDSRASDVGFRLVQEVN